ncbi:uncharacterized protein LOC119768609 [Culex quinquefasciatus]|uniref:uncharacterized protein LOC119768609 n=1 Tax=Culex quinquefasciatus TaxID=7176 RepID=UPI0018E36DAC|nr:uncharacterized protein LOC119768609 [Culex quinquefasciatus]XP_038114680.1 uncharacterized protein LOC119768609 [Culex quinquefasciatus]
MGRYRFAIEVAVGVLLSAGGWGTYLMKLATNVFQSDPAVHVWSRVASVEPTEAATLFRTHTPQTHIVSSSGGHQFDDQFVGDPRLSSHPCTTLISSSGIKSPAPKCCQENTNPSPKLRSRKIKEF